MDPDQTISPASIKVHHILPAMAAGRPLAREVLPRFLQYIGADVLVAHNARYDRDFINREMRRHFGPPLLSPLVDVWALSRANSDLRRKYRVSGATDNHTLDALAAGLGLTFEDRHSAFGDALATALVFIKLMKGLQRFGIYRVRHLMKAGGLG
jgi:DNA polymerase-3 subunit epsilon